MSEVLKSLDGEDVCVCMPPFGDDDNMSLLFAKIAESESSTIVVLFDSKVEGQKNDADRFLRIIAKKLPRPIHGDRKFNVFSMDEWSAFKQMHQNEAFSLIDIGRKTLPLKSDADEELMAFDDIPKIKRLMHQIVNLFSVEKTGKMLPVALLEGDTGTGKSFAARAIYNTLKHRGLKGRFVHLNCALLGAEDMNAALFGVAKGAFTGTTQRDGAIKNADGGILFLDEIGTLPLLLQSRLLTVLDEGEYYLHGSTDGPLMSNCGFLFGTNCDLEKAVIDGSFRFDLHSRICGMRVRLPSLANRIKGPQGESFLLSTIDRFCKDFGEVVLTRNAKAILIDFAKAHEWRGNFRHMQWLFRDAVIEMKIAGGKKVISAAAMVNAIRRYNDDLGKLDELWQYKNDTKSDERMAVALQRGLSNDTLLKGRTDISEDDKRNLEFALACAAESSTCTAAGKRYYKKNPTANPCKKFQRFLEEYGFKWDINVHGHVSQMS